MVAVRKSQFPKDGPLREQHEMRVQVAESTLALNPLRDFGIGKIVDRARESTMEIVRPELCEWLPDVTMYFIVPSMTAFDQPLSKEAKERIRENWCLNLPNGETVKDGFELMFETS